jgi:hypothetical protein
VAKAVATPAIGLFLNFIVNAVRRKGSVSAGEENQRVNMNLRKE